MPDLLLELFSEEIPARFQRRAAEDLRKAVTDGLVAAGLLYEGARAFVTPRRLALHVVGVPVRSPDVVEERRGPRVGAPQQAIEGFLKAAGLAAIEAASIQSDPKKGDFYVARVEKPGAAAVDVIRSLIPEVIAGFPWPKSMKWGDGRLDWVRPLRAIVATFGALTEEPEVIAFTVGDVTAGNVTYGHRFLAPAPIRVRRFDDYSTALERARVVLDLDRRKEVIRNEAQHLAFAQGLKLIADEGLLEEVAGLVEWPVVMMGAFEPGFLAVPEEVIIATIRANQKCFCLRSADGRLADRFILTANTIAEDGGATIVAGNERVIRARLSDAKFFYEQDLAKPLDSGVPKLADVVFHARLGTQLERVERLERLAAGIAPKVGADPALAQRAARLAKADLVSGMVGEFPELQGIMGRYYALAQGEDPRVADAIAAHYRPLGPTDAVPAEPVAIAVALADKLDLLTGFWAIDEKPTGSRDPYALRRAALGVIRIVVENKLALHLERLFVDAHLARAAGGERTYADEKEAASAVRSSDLLAFFHDRLKVMLREQGARHDLVDAVLTEGADDILAIVQRVEALSALLDTEDGKNLLAGYRRAVNILTIEEKKDGRTWGGDFVAVTAGVPAEQALYDALRTADVAVHKAIDADDYRAAVTALAALRAPVDAFFEAVLVNDPDPDLRQNRLNLLAKLRDVTHLIADFSRVAG